MEQPTREDFKNMQDEVAQASEIPVNDKRSAVYKLWAKHKRTITIAGAVLVGWYMYKRFKK